MVADPWYKRFFKANSPEMWQRLMPLWHFSFFALLAIAVFLLTTSTDVTSYSITTWGLLHISYIGWYSVSTRYEPDFWREHQLYFGVYLLIGWAIWWMLLGGSGVYFVLLTGLFPQLYIYLRFRNTIIGTIILNTLTLIRISQLVPGFMDTWLVLMLMSTAGGVILAYFINSIIEQSRDRRRLIEELQETRAQLADAERLAGIAHERQRLAADLHDTLVQSLISVVTHLEAAENTPRQTQHHLQTAKQAARDSLYDARQVIQGLRPPANDADTFRDEILKICQKWKSRSNLAIEFMQAGNAIRLPDELQHAIIRITQEALANISRHADASQVFVTLKFIPDAVKLFIADDGKGFDTQVKTGNGIPNMRQRTETFDGTFSVESCARAGTTITVVFPLQLIMSEESDAD